MTDRPACIIDELHLGERPFRRRLNLRPGFAGVLGADDTTVVADDDKGIARGVGNIEELVGAADHVLHKFFAIVPFTAGEPKTKYDG